MDLSSGLTKKALPILIILLIIYVAYILSPLFSKIFGYVGLILYPFILAMVLYYLFRPIVRLLRKKMSIYVAIFLTYCGFALILGILAAYIYPNIISHLNLASALDTGDLPKMFDQKLEESLHYNSKTIGELKNALGSYLIKLNSIIINNILLFIQLVAEFVMALLVVPFILFYLLKDDHRLYNKLSERVPEKYTQLFKSLAQDVDKTLVQFINGRLVVSLIISTLLLVCFLAIGLDYAFYLYLSCLIFYVIPTLGAFIAVFPPLLVGFATSSMMGVEVIVVMAGASFVEGFVVTPKVMGKSLYIHPLTVVLVLMVAGTLYGIPGLIVASPVYALLKVFVTHGKTLFLSERP